jgi:DNA-binding NtrC family response regulator
MLTPLRVLIIEDSESDADLVRYYLRKAGFELTWERVESAAEMQTALARQTWDIILSDYNLPGFDAPAALALLKQSQLEIPFIVDSGTITEETALELIRAGAADFLMKDRLASLGAMVKRELHIS